MTPTDTPTPEPPKRLTLSSIVERLLDREGSSTNSSSISLERDRNGETLIGVVIRFPGDGNAETVADADKLARTVYDALRADYPMLSGTDNGERSSVTISRNSKGEAQVEVSETGDSSTVMTRAQERFSQLIATYPLSTGYVLAKSPVTTSTGSDDGGQA
jgi:hypothetical protein